MSKKLNLAEFNKIDKSINTTREVLIGDEQYKVKIADFIRDSQVDEFMIELNEIIEEVKKTRKVTGKTLRDIVSLQPVLMIRKFTDVYVPKENDVETLIKVSNAYADAGILKLVMDEFSEEQIDKINQRVAQLFSKDTGRLMAELGAQLDNQNKELDKNA